MKINVEIDVTNVHKILEPDEFLVISPSGLWSIAQDGYYPRTTTLDYTIRNQNPTSLITARIANVIG